MNSPETAHKTPMSDLGTILLEAAAAGGRALLDAPRGKETNKLDGSPVTAADVASDAAIQLILRSKYPAIPIISEEGPDDFSAVSPHDPFFLLDPLDGTKEYIAGSSEFVICIGQIISQRPVAGIILAPLMRRAWLATDGKATSFALDHRLLPLLETRQSFVLSDSTSPALQIITSRSHLDSRSLALLKHHGGCSHRTAGSALKFASVATGEADLYPRGAGSMEWDTAAGEAIILAAGGAMLDENGMPLVYGKAKAGFRNFPFIAGRSEELVHKALAQWDS